MIVKHKGKRIVWQGTLAKSLKKPGKSSVGQSKPVPDQQPLEKQTRSLDKLPQEQQPQPKKKPVQGVARAQKRATGTKKPSKKSKSKK